MGSGLAFLLAVFAGAGTANETPLDPSRFAYRVHVSVTASDGLKERIEEILLARLEAMADVQIAATDATAKFTLHIAAGELRGGGIDSAYVLSVLWLSRPPLWEWLANPKSQSSMDPMQKQAIRFFMAGAKPWLLRHHAVQSGSMKDLDAACSAVAMAFEEEVLQPERDADHQVEKLLEDRTIGDPPPREGFEARGDRPARGS